MVVITVKLYQDANVDIIPDEKNEELFWVKMTDIQNGLGIKNMAQMVRQQMLGIFGTKNLTKEQQQQKKQYIRLKCEINKSFNNEFPCCKYARSDITEKIIKNCRGVKQCNDGINRLDKEKQREDFRIFLAFKQNKIFERKEYSIIKRIRKIFKTK